MKFALALALLPYLSMGYTMRGYNRFGRPVVITNAQVGRGPCSSPSCGPSRKDVVDRAFEQLQNEVEDSMKGDSRWRRDRRNRRRRFVEENFRRPSEAAVQQQQEWLDRAFGLASDVAAANMSPKDSEFLKQAFGVATDLSSGRSSPRYEIDDGEEAFQVYLDVPGVKASEIEINVVDEDDGDKVLTIEGQREMSKADGVSRVTKFSKSFTLDANALDTERISAELSNGVLTVSVPKDLEKMEKKTRKIPVVVSEEKDTTVVEGNKGSTAMDDTEPPASKDDADGDVPDDTDASSEDN